MPATVTVDPCPEPGPNSGGELKLLAAIQERSAIEKSLRRLALEARVVVSQRVV